ncbi:protein-L-isoaspartate O-methyltransferase domain-containing protein 1 isoform X5 [Kogia breviceps]|uniref:protein-L-isoaspartate O-methyltransferase domain-containing protein 1 isoform X5 n=1 Tax=Kogia breviceps TaxID=27615 RepID=UPI0034D1D041
MGRPRALLISASSRRPSRPPPSAHARSPPARRPRRSGFPNQRPGPAPPPGGGGGGGGGGGRVVLAAALAAAEPAESQRLTCARCGGPTDRLATVCLCRAHLAGSVVKKCSVQPGGSTRASHPRGLSRCGAQAPDAQAQRPRLTGPAAPRHVGSSPTGARTRIPRIGRRTLNPCATREAQHFLILLEKSRDVNEPPPAACPSVSSRCSPLSQVGRRGGLEECGTVGRGTGAALLSWG